MFSLQDFMEDEDRALSDLVEPIASTSQGRRRGLGRGVRPRGVKAETGSRESGGAKASVSGRSASSPEGREA